MAAAPSIKTPTAEPTAMPAVVPVDGLPEPEVDDEGPGLEVDVALTAVVERGDVELAGPDVIVEVAVLQRGSSVEFQAINIGVS